MALEQLRVVSLPRIQDATMLVALTGWMDGGLVSTGTVKQLMDGRAVSKLASIDPDDFYIHHFPGSMEIASLFRPHVKYDGGIVQRFDWPTNEFFADPVSGIVFFIGHEPHLRWQRFADCIFAVAERIGVRRIIFMGSFGGTVPHTREPRLFGSISHPRLAAELKQHGVQLSEYEGPASFATLLLSESAPRGLEMISIAAEIPGYLQGLNPLSIEAVTRRLARLLNLPVDLARLRESSNEWEQEVTEAVAKDPELAQTVRTLEERYDNALIGIEMHEGAADESDDEASN